MYTSVISLYIFIYIYLVLCTLYEELVPVYTYLGEYMLVVIVVVIDVLVFLTLRST